LFCKLILAIIFLRYETIWIIKQFNNEKTFKNSKNKILNATIK